MAKTNEILDYIEREFTDQVNQWPANPVVLTRRAVDKVGRGMYAFEDIGEGDFTAASTLGRALTQMGVKAGSSVYKKLRRGDVIRRGEYEYRVLARGVPTVLPAPVDPDRVVLRPPSAEPARGTRGSGILGSVVVHVDSGRETPVRDRAVYRRLGLSVRDRQVLALGGQIIADGEILELKP